MCVALCNWRVDENGRGHASGDYKGSRIGLLVWGRPTSSQNKPGRRRVSNLPEVARTGPDERMIFGLAALVYMRCVRAICIIGAYFATLCRVFGGRAKRSTRPTDCGFITGCLHDVIVDLNWRQLGEQCLDSWISCGTTDQTDTAQMHKLHADV